MEIPKEIRDKFQGKGPVVDPREKKKQSRIMFRKRKLDKDVKNYIKYNRVLKSTDFERIGRQHGFHIS